LAIFLIAIKKIKCFAGVASYEDFFQVLAVNYKLNRGILGVLPCAMQSYAHLCIDGHSHKAMFLFPDQIPFFVKNNKCGSRDSRIGHSEEVFVIRRGKYFFESYVLVLCHKLTFLAVKTQPFRFPINTFIPYRFLRIKSVICS
jgi:hypothetical protein